ncbi:hypothetical protein NV379_11320 [Paenibacillus sp. N1-5-1-14]|uniref:hypothetical protein n=1 Tax=Paenibacillus radicibacter TaxID=2972488 RepID=UPI002158C9A7|nr:hypothetical protein [Paenibacillus radicibacter]MCR8643251.1 hypothetical protein [Paenibacillus radicibacter]
MKKKVGAAMYTFVHNHKQLSKFQHIWKEVWNEKGYELEDCQHVLDQLLVRNAEGMEVGTVEFKSYNLDKNNPLNLIAPFDRQPELIGTQGPILEIDKVALLREHRGNNLARLMSTIVHYAKAHQCYYGVCLLEPVFARALRVSFHVPMRQISKRIVYKGDDVVPTIIYLGEIFQQSSQFDWLLGRTKLAYPSTGTTRQ